MFHCNFSSSGSDTDTEKGYHSDGGAESEGGSDFSARVSDYGSSSEGPSDTSTLGEREGSATGSLAGGDSQSDTSDDSYTG